MTLRTWIPTAALLAALVASGCATATEARINDNQDLFDGYEPSVQAMIKSNRIDNGFDTTQVYLSLGNADRTEAGDGQQIWYYHQTHTNTVREEKTAAEYREEMRDYEDAIEEGAENLQEPTTFRMVTYYRTRVAQLVVFEEGRVVSWETPEDMWLDEWHN